MADRVTRDENLSLSPTSDVSLTLSTISSLTLGCGAGREGGSEGGGGGGEPREKGRRGREKKGEKRVIRVKKWSVKHRS